MDSKLDNIDKEPQSRTIALVQEGLAMSTRSPTTDNVIAVYRTLTYEAGRSTVSSTAKRTWFDKIFGRKPKVLVDDQIKVHMMSPERVFQAYSTHPTLGLEAPAVQRNKKTSKANLLSPPPNDNFKKWMGYLFGGFNSLMWVAMILSILSYQPLGSLQGGTPQVFNLGVGVLLAFVVLVSTLFYAFVDYNASQVMKSIKMLLTNTAVVIRDGAKVEIPAKEVLVGDIVALSMGDKVPADLYIFEASFDLKFDKALLTGESDPVSGTTTVTDDNPYETKNLALSSTLVVQGSMKGVVFAIGDDTVVGKVVALANKNSNLQSNLQKEIQQFSLIVSILAVSLFLISMLFWGVNTQVNHPGFATASGAIINAIGCLTAFVPQGLPVCVALSLTVIAQRMAAQKVLIKNLATIETVGSMSVLCSDKTGTLTEGKMSVEQVGLPGQIFTSAERVRTTSTGQFFLSSLTTCNDAYIEQSGTESIVRGNSTDVAVFKFNASSPAPSWKKVASFPFNSKNKWMAVIVQDEKNGYHLIVKGGPDVLIPTISHVQNYDGTLAVIDKDQVMKLQESWSSEGQRVLIVCSKQLKISALPNDQIMDDFVASQLSSMNLLGLVGIRDPPRKQVPAAVEKMRQAGIRVFMVTGDFRATALAIARQVGIVTSLKPEMADDSLVQKYGHHVGKKAHEMKPSGECEPKAIVLTGTDVSTFESKHWDIVFSEFEEIVFARTTPEQKCLIVEELKKRGDSVVGVTGDGTNDAPALKGTTIYTAADIGFAMGAGSDVAKESAHMVLLTNDFSAILVGIENGRLVYDNIKKVLLYIMPTGSYTEMMTVIGNVFLGMQSPLSSYLQVAFSIFNDVVMSVSLMFEKAESDLMLKKPRNTRTEFLTDWQFFFTIYGYLGVMSWFSCFGMYFLYWRSVGFGFYDLVGVWDNWGDGYLGHSIDDLSRWVSVSQAVFYVTMTIMQLGNILAIRNRRVSILESNPLWGKRMNLVLIPCVITHLTVTVLNVYASSAPGNSNIFQVGFVPGIYWLIPIPLALGVVLIDEVRKLAVRTWPNSVVATLAW
jgi:sodium/potassium-transporting ATPase subunit alpha